MKKFDHSYARTRRVSKRLPVPKKPVNLFLGNQFDPQRNAGLEQPFFNQAKHAHIGYAQFLSGLFHRVGVPLQRLIVFRVKHSKQNGKLGELQVKDEAVGNSRMINGIPREKM